MKYCPKCNALLNKEAKSCSECGAEIESENKTSELTQTPIVPKQKSKKSSNRLLWIIVIVLTLVIIGALITAFFIFWESDEENSNSTIPSTQNLNLNANRNTNVNVNLNQNVNADENMNSNANANVNENANASANENTNQEQSAQTDLVNPLRPPIPETIVTASSTLIDNSGTGFNYSSSQVLDQDFSTAWVEGVNGYGVGEWIKMEFPGTAEINTVGIVPGYARDEEIYNENDRVADLELEFSDGTKITKTLSDQYGMQFIEFPLEKTTFIKLTIKGIYDGSKYQDAGIAELDIWSDYVTNKDAQAALEYYQTNKESAALKPPVRYIEKTYMAIGIMGSPTPEIPVNFYSPAMEPFIAAAEILATTPQGITFTAKWFNEGNLFHTQDITNYPLIAGLDTITIVSTAQISDLVSPPDVLWPLGDYDVRWYENGQLSTTQIFAVTPQ